MSGFTLHGTELRDRQKGAIVNVELKRKVAAGVDKFASRKFDVLKLIAMSSTHGDELVGDANQLRAAARAMRHRTIERLPQILERFADNLLANGVHVHWANDGETTTANGCLLCHHHHHAVHEGGWTITGNANHQLTFTAPSGTTLTSHPPGLTIYEAA